MKRALVVFLAASMILPACTHTGTIPTSQNQSGAGQTLSGIVHGNFTEYAVPAGSHPAEITRGPYNTLWFHSPVLAGTHAIAYRFSEGTGATVAYTLPNDFPSWSTGIASTGGFVWFFAADAFGSEDNVYLVRVDNSGHFTLFADKQGDSPIFGITVGPDGKLWYPLCVEACGNAPGDYVFATTVTATNAPTVQLLGFTARSVTPGPNGDMYATAVNIGANPPAGSVFVISLAGAILHKYSLPSTSSPYGITTGADHNLWVTEPGINKIARVTPSGTITQFSVPTVGAGLSEITYGTESALWFTETNANKIGRITTSGAITEYPIPTANAGAFGVASCTSNCGTHGGVWFSETNANKIGRFNSPI